MVPEGAITSHNFEADTLVNAMSAPTTWITRTGNVRRYVGILCSRVAALLGGLAQRAWSGGADKLDMWDSTISVDRSFSLPSCTRRDIFS